MVMQTEIKEKSEKIMDLYPSSPDESLWLDKIKQISN